MTIEDKSWPKTCLKNVAIRNLNKHRKMLEGNVENVENVPRYTKILQYVK